ncbi:SLC13 family permease [Neorickettsia sennetsu]|uniref:Transporter n=1 Tax=Ehrlichia sennetsu (strain ATCC VR-367 / Miyayama) TaxID=222891 RepID=Q2GEP0_EHRS3|nr:SLC13 family permease [Neorickettsia sennetsu]ABD45900.1 putative transporter [Neorickettsia sennetsu str. Miyayama]
MLNQLLVDLAPLYVVSVLIVSTYLLVNGSSTTERITFVSIVLLVVYQSFTLSKPLAFLESTMIAPVIAILGLAIMGRLVACTSVVNRAAVLIVEIKHKALIPVILILLCFILSAFVNNTPVVVLLISFVSTFGKQVGIANSRMMLPIAFSASLGGMLTVLGSSTNFLIYSKAEELGVELGFFGFFLPAIFVGIFGIIYVIFLTLILPIRKPVEEHVRRFLFVLNSSKSGRLIFSSVGIHEIKNILHNHVFGDNLIMNEIVITEKSELIGYSILSDNVASYFNACAVGITHTSEKIVPGSRLIIVCKETSPYHREGEVFFAKDKSCILSHANSVKVICAFIGMVLLSGILKIPLALTVLSGLALLIVLNAVDVKEVFRFLEVKLLLMLVYSLTIGTSLEMTGLPGDFVQLLYQCTRTLSPIALICILFAIVTLLNEVMSNNAVGLIFTPVVLKLSHMMGLEAKYLLWTLIFASNSAFATPFGYQVNLIVMEAGKYKYSDYLKFGFPLNVVVLVGYILYLHLFSELDFFHCVSHQ